MRQANIEADPLPYLTAQQQHVAREQQADLISFIAQQRPRATGAKDHEPGKRHVDAACIDKGSASR
uniref:Uncharacterized protein n=1 Tax=viral metagenome TaxID=1070528 RepID=A0A6M3MCV7_9ZZZZ